MDESEACRAPEALNDGSMPSVSPGPLPAETKTAETGPTCEDQIVIDTMGAAAARTIEPTLKAAVETKKKPRSKGKATKAPRVPRNEAKTKSAGAPSKRRKTARTTAVQAPKTGTPSPAKNANEPGGASGGPASSGGGGGSRAQPNDPEAAQMIVRAWPHVREMMTRRGYDVEASPGGMAPAVSLQKAATAPIYRILEPLDQESIDAALADARRQGKKRAHVNRPSGAIMLVFTAVPRINVDTVRVVVERIKRIIKRGSSETGVPRRVLILSCRGHTTQVPAEIAKLAAPVRVRVDMATYTQHFFCSVDHELVPRHDILSPAQRTALLARLKHPDASLLPKQKRGDAVSYFYGLEAGDIVLYHRPMGTLELVRYYRAVSDD